MCWYSVEHSGLEILEAETGERLCIRQAHGYARWVVREDEMAKDSPRPVCLLNGTSVLFRPLETQRALPEIDPEVPAVFRMRSNPRRDLFEWPDGRQIELKNLPVGLLFDVMMVPGKERLAAILAGGVEPVGELVSATSAAKPEESLLTRVRRLF